MTINALNLIQEKERMNPENENFSKHFFKYEKLKGGI